MITKGLCYNSNYITNGLNFIAEAFLSKRVFKCYKDFNGKRGNSMTEYILNEGSTAVIGLWFKDENEKNVVPSEIIWRVDDVRSMEVSGASGGELVPDTTEIPTTYKHNIYVPASANYIIDDTTIWEEKLVTIRWTYGESGVGTEEMRYKVKNLIRIPSVPINPGGYNFVIDGGGA